VIVSMPEPHAIPAKGGGEIKSFLVPNPFKEDAWVTAIEIRPGNPSVVHHVIVSVTEESVGALAWGNMTPPFVPGRTPVSRPTESGGGGGYGGGRTRIDEQARESGAFATMEAVYVPGSPPTDFSFHNSAKRIRGGSPIRIEVHYTPNGKATSDRTMIGFTLAEGRAKRRFVTMAPTSLVDTRNTRIPAGASDWESRGELTFTRDAELVWFMPHMHLRGKDMTFRLVYPNGRSDTVLRAKFNFAWQLGYEVEEPIRVPRGTRMIVTAHHDNSANNPFNPDPSQDVRWGELTSQEMMLPWFGVVVDRDIDPEDIASYRPAGLTESRERFSRSIPGVQPRGSRTPPFITNQR
jgi:hypothetical protein